MIAVHDISCIGRCSLTAALPIISAAGFETTVLPTAVLSTHTGGFVGYTYRDLTTDMQKIIDHWKKLGIRADAIYTGYLGSRDQLAIVDKLIAEFRDEDTFVLVDPVMGDSGRLYANFEKSFISGMKGLSRSADMIVPNITEASMMLGMEYIETGYSRDYVETMLVKLSQLGPRYSVLSGISFERGKIGACAYDKKKNEFCYYASSLCDGFYHGTGDVFASALIGAFLHSRKLDSSIKIAVDFTARAIARTFSMKNDTRYGVAFEPELGFYINSIFSENNK